MKQKSPGSKLGAIAGAVLVLSFFLPWVRACGRDVNGYALATSQGVMESPWLIWLIVVAGVFCILLYFVARSDTARARTGSAAARLIAVLLGLWPLLNLRDEIAARKLGVGHMSGVGRPKPQPEPANAHLALIVQRPVEGAYVQVDVPA